MTGGGRGARVARVSHRISIDLHRDTITRVDIEGDGGTRSSYRTNDVIIKSMAI